MFVILTRIVCNDRAFLADWANISMKVFRNLIGSFSGFAFLIGIVFFCLSLTPSLLPRPILLQGVLSGLVLAVGYGVGHLILVGWHFLQLPDLPVHLRTKLTTALSLIALTLAAVTLWRAPAWQNSIRAVMEMEPVEASSPFVITATALAVGVSIILLTWLLVWLGSLVVRVAARALPDRIALAVGATAFMLLLVSLINGFIVRQAVSAMDQTFAVLDRSVDDSITPPALPTVSGGPGSLIAWQDIGRTGKNFIAQGSTASDIAKFHGGPALDPIRIYAGFNAADTITERADLALADLIRAGGFERSTLIVATATGTGWLDPAAIEPLAFITGGDVAIVTLQYSYLPSWMTLIIDPNRSRIAAKTLFDAVYGYWSTLPKHTRPDLYLFGLSLGALGSESSVDLITLFEDPINGALWSGPPFASTVWPSVVEGRNVGSAPWRPTYRDGKLIRFMTQEGLPDGAQDPWGKMRLLYLQHPSDPMSFFTPGLAFNRPDWLEDRGPDISPYFNWYPLVTFFQVLFDIPLATSVPAGYGHTFKAEEYIEAWIELLNPPSWTSTQGEALKARFADFEASPI